MSNPLSIRRSLDDSVAKTRLCDENSQTKLINVIGKSGTGKTTLVNCWLNDLSKTKFSVLKFDHIMPIQNEVDLLLFILQNLEGTAFESNLLTLKNKYCPMYQKDLFSFLSTGTANLGNLSGKEIADALNIYLDTQKLWIVLDHGSMRNDFVFEWIKGDLLPFHSHLGLILVWDELSNLDISDLGFPVLNINVEPFLDEDVRLFVESFRRPENLLSILSFDEILKITQNLPIWLQLLTVIPKDCFKMQIFSFNDSLIDFFGKPGHVNSILEGCLEIRRDNIANSDNWLWASPLVETWHSGSLILHSCIREKVLSDVGKGEQSLSNVLSSKLVQSLTNHPGQKVKDTDISFYISNLSLLESRTLYDCLSKIIIDVAIYAPLALNDLILEFSQPSGEKIRAFYNELINHNFLKLPSRWAEIFEIKRIQSQFYIAKYNTILGFLHYLCDENSVAASCFDRAIETNQDEPLIYFGRGLLEEDSRNFKDAVIQFSKCITLDGNFPSAFLERGSCFFSLGELDNALNDFLRTLEINPFLIHPAINIATLYAKLGENDQAKYWLSRAFEIDPEETSKYISLVNNN